MMLDLLGAALIPVFLVADDLDHDPREPVASGMYGHLPPLADGLVAEAMRYAMEGRPTGAEHAREHRARLAALRGR